MTEKEFQYFSKFTLTELKKKCDGKFQEGKIIRYDDCYCEVITSFKT